MLQRRKKVAPSGAVWGLNFRQPLDFVDKSGFVKKVRQVVFFPLAAFGVFA